MTKTIDCKSIEEFEKKLRSEEKGIKTIQKYLRDVRRFVCYAEDREVNKELVLEYKEKLSGIYSKVSANSVIAAINKFLKYIGLSECCVKQYKIQKSIYCSEEKELTKAEYERLVRCAEQKGNERLSLILQTICGTGIRISELNCVTVEAVKKGEASVNCKGKLRTVFIVSSLRKKLLNYIRKKNIEHGSVFVTKSGKPICRSNVWREMKALCAEADVLPSKVFPHNLRHLFARIFYNIEKDIAKLADILGHSSIETTRIYIIETGEQHRRKMERMRLII